MKLNLIIVLVYAVCITADSKSNSAYQGDIPYQVSLRSTDGHFCSGAILNKHFILTTANCVYAQIPNWIYAVGGTSLMNGDGQRVDIKTIKSHPDFNVVSMKSNIALLETVKIYFGSYVDTVKLPPYYDWSNDNSRLLNVSGWNQVNVDSDSDRLQYQDAIIERCRVQGTNINISSDIFCTNASESNFHPGKGSLMTDRHETGIILVGILSRYNNLNTDETDIYTRISSFLPWIEKNSKIEENADSITWESILIVTSLLIISILIGVFSVKLAKNRLKISQTPTATTLPTVSSISNDYASNLQLPQGHVPRIASVPTIPSPVTPPPSYEHLFPDKP